jgi:hypothetical protein
MRMGIALSIGIWVGIAAFVSGCSGIGATIGGEIYRIDERSHQSQTHNKKTGLRCLFVSCDEQGEVRGS